MKRVIGFLVLTVSLGVNIAFGDRGFIPFEPEVKIFEPTQRALIAWNGKEEILILTTDLKASKATEVLEVIPLPSEPVVKKGDIKIFRKATELINRKLTELYRKNIFRMPLAGAMKGPEKAPAGEITFYKKIGAHSISVTHVLDSDGFIEWVEKYLQSSGVKNPVIPQDMKDVIREYLKEGFTWFVFDVVSLNEKLSTNEAIQYRFKTNYLFYPLRITRTGEGNTTIDLLILTPQLLSKFLGIPYEQVKLQHEPVSISSKELQDLSKELDELLGHRKATMLRIWRIEGKLSAFKKDLIVSKGG